MIDEKAFQLDIHTHTIASGHAYGTIREMAAAAAERELALLGFAEHGPGVPGTCDPFYFLNISAVPRRLSGVEIVHGCEANVLNGGAGFELPQRCIDRLDYIIAGVHLPWYRDEGAEKNTDNVIACMEHEKVFFISHPDNDNAPLLYGRLVEAAKEYHVALEVNNSSLLKPDRRLNCVENYRTMLRLCREYSVPIVVSSDAHDPFYVGRFAESCELLNTEGFDRELIINTSVEKFKAHIGRKKK